MGLSKTETKYGQSVDYWVIVKFPSDMISRAGQVVLLGYPTRQIYKDHPRVGNPNWARRQYQIPREDFDPIYSAALDDTYSYNLHEMLYGYVTRNQTVLPTRADGTQIEGARPDVDTDADGTRDATWFEDATAVHE